MAAILEVSGLKKAYKNFELKNVSFSIHEDCITGFIGVNGAGKTTTINALLNLIHRDGGIVKFRGKDISTDEKTFDNSQRFFQYNISLDMKRQSLCAFCYFFPLLLLT